MSALANHADLRENFRIELYIARGEGKREE
jgi:hypothetical protein